MFRKYYIYTKPSLQVNRSDWHLLEVGARAMERLCHSTRSRNRASHLTLVGTRRSIYKQCAMQSATSSPVALPRSCSNGAPLIQWTHRAGRRRHFTIANNNSALAVSARRLGPCVDACSREEHTGRPTANNRPARLCLSGCRLPASKLRPAPALGETHGDVTSAADAR